VHRGRESRAQGGVHLIHTFNLPIEPSSITFLFPPIVPHGGRLAACQYGIRMKSWPATSMTSALSSLTSSAAG
jgi:hypothetical protein